MLPVSPTWVDLSYWQGSLCSFFWSQVGTVLDGGGQGAEMNSRAVSSALNAHDHLTFTLSLQLHNLSAIKQCYAEIWTKQGIVFNSCQTAALTPAFSTPAWKRRLTPQLPCLHTPSQPLQSHLGSLPKPWLWPITLHTLKNKKGRFRLWLFHKESIPFPNFLR